ncbi:SixA phosphatase family protein [Colwellia sp. MEBiC06753]
MKAVHALWILVIMLFALPAKEIHAEQFTVYLTRHAEKQSEGKDPNLTGCGQLRANQLAELFKNIELAAVYSTPYQRTLATAGPTANSKNIRLVQYAANGLSQLARTIKQNKQTVLVVGHSNTTPELLALLTGQASAPMTEQEYQHLYQLQFNHNEVVVTDITQPLRCN